ncbi:histidine phosphotransferase family protein [Kamptonema cortianum]|nr:histidine phosphotransferase family protein [Geitlerinema splendidum]MDK3160879.1 histidine phosphotransferase family protein [Kamptonema cortianum]
MAPEFSLRLAELLSSRFCHDLVTPIGAINTGLELFQENVVDLSEDSKEIIDLIQHSSQVASSRLSFFRIAFGSSGERTSFGEARTLIENYFSRSKIEFEWKTPFQEDLILENWGRLLLNSVLWVSECAPKGGIIQVTLPDKTSAKLSVGLDADSIILHQGTLEALEGKVSLSDLTPRTIPCYLIHNLVKEINGLLEYRKTELPSGLLLEIRGSK